MSAGIQPPYKGEQSYIFISYAHKDTRVYSVINHLLESGYRVWYDEGIDPGTEWDENIAVHVANCDAFVAFISENYIASENCKDELNYARDIGKDRLLIYLEDVALPPGMAMRLNRLQAIQMYRYQQEAEFYGKLYETAMFARNKEDAVPQETHEEPERVIPEEPEPKLPKEPEAARQESPELPKEPEDNPQELPEMPQEPEAATPELPEASTKPQASSPQSPKPRVKKNRNHAKKKSPIIVVQSSSVHKFVEKNNLKFIEDFSNHANGTYSDVFHVRGLDDAKAYVIKLCLPEAIPYIPLLKDPKLCSELMQVSHPNFCGLVRVLRSYIVPSLLTNYPGHDYLSRVDLRQENLTRRDVLHMMSELLEALDCLHQKGIYYGDLMTPNVIFSQNKRGHRLILCEHSACNYNGMPFSAEYSLLKNFGAGFRKLSSPEKQSSNRPRIDFRSDIYEAGMLMQYLVDNCLTIEEELDRFPPEENGMQRGTLEDITENIMQIIQRATAPKPEHRPSAKEMLGELASIAERCDV